MNYITWTKNKFDELYSPEINGNLFVNMPSKAVFDKFLPEGFVQDHILGIVVGTDSGLLLTYLQEKAEKHHSVYVCIEKTEIVNYLRQQGWNDSYHVKLVEDNFQLTELLISDDGYDEFLLRRAVFLLSSIAPIDKKLDYSELLEKYKHQFNGLTLSQNMNAINNVFIDSQLNNLSEMFYQAKLLKQVFSGKTAVLLGGGPSVSMILDWVKDNRDDIVIFAANRLSSRLKTEKIVPDFFCAVDPQPALLDYSREMFSFAKESILLCSSAMASNVVLQWAGSIIYGDHLPNFFKEETEQITTGPTVMNYALQAAGYAGFDHIILAGVDLCYSKEGYSHESSSLEAQLGKFLKQGGNQVETYQGYLANTDVQMAQARDTMQEQVNFFKKYYPDTHCYQINCQAAKIEGVDLITIADIPLPDISPSSLMTTLKNQISWKSDIVQEILQQRMSLLEDRISLYRNLRYSIKNVLVDIRRLDRLKDRSFTHAVNNVNKIKDKIEKQLGDSLFQLFDYAYLDYAKVVEPLSDNDQMTLKDIQLVLLNYFSATDKVLLKYGNALSKSLAKFKLRLREAQGNLDQSMLDQWFEYDEPGRGAVWLAHNPNVQLSQDQQKLLAKAEAAFVELLANKVPSFKSKFTNKNFRMISFWQQVKGALETEDIDRLTALTEHLLEQQEDHDLLSLGYYAKLCLASLHRDWLLIIEDSSQIDHENLRIPVLQLKLKAYLATNQAILAFDILGILIQYMPEYMLQYATVAMMLGKSEIAVEAVQAYMLKAGVDEFVARQAWQWAIQYQQITLQNWLKDYIVSVLPSSSSITA